LLILCLWPAALCAQIMTDDHDSDGNVFALIFYMGTTTTGLGSTALTAIGLVSSIHSDKQPSADARKVALRVYLRDTHHELDAALALGGGAVVKELGALMGWTDEERAQLAHTLRAQRGQIAALARRAVLEDEALDALFVLLWRG
jgi:hypothetical protein